MKVQQLIDKLQKISDKQMKVKIVNKNETPEDVLDGQETYIIDKVHTQMADGWEEYLEIVVE